MNTEKLTHDIDYEWCARCLSNCETARARLNRRNRVFIGLLTGVALSLVTVVFLARSDHWIISGLIGSGAVLLAIGACSQWKEVRLRRARFFQAGQAVEVLREILPLAGAIRDISPQQSALLVNRLSHLPIFPSAH